jgi:hypothetical protein
VTVLLSAVIFAEGDVQDPMLTVFDAPTDSRGPGQSFPVRLLVADVVPRCADFFPVALGDGDDTAHARRVAPCAAVTQGVRYGRRILKTLLPAVVADRVGFVTGPEALPRNPLVPTHPIVRSIAEWDQRMDSMMRSPDFAAAAAIVQVIELIKMPATGSEKDQQDIL